MFTFLTKSIRMKVIAIVLVIAMVVMVAVYEIGAKLVRSSYDSIEHDEMAQNLNRAQDAFQSEVNTMWLKIKDWGFWDDLYSYALNPAAHRDFEEANFNDFGLANVDINLLMFIDRNGSIAFKKIIDLETGAAITNSTVPEDLLHAAPQMMMPKDANNKSVVRGVVLLPQGVLLVAAVPVLQTDQTGPSAGTLIFGKFIDKKLLSQISDTTHVPIEMFPYGATSPAEIASAEKKFSAREPYVIEPLSENTIVGYLELQDVNDTPAATVRLETHRDIYQQGKFVLWALTISIGIAILIFGVATTILLEQYVVNRLTNLSERVRAIGQTRDFTARINEDGYRDEVGALTQAINAMLTDLGNTRLKEAKHAESEKTSLDQLKDHTNEAERLNQIMAGREEKMTEMKKTIQELKKQLGEA